VKLFIRIALFAAFLSLSFSDIDNPLSAGNQETRTDTLLYFKGRVLDSINRQPLAFTHIINIGRGTATICDTLGYFYIHVRLLDTIYFTAIGYTPLEIVFNDSLRLLERMPDFLMRDVRYSIPGVMINPLGSYESFKQKLIELELEPSKYEINPTVLVDIEKGTDTLDMVQTPGISPVTALYNWLSKEGKSRRKLKQIMEQEQFEKDIAFKYSPLIVSGITGYAGFELYQFMDFCSFNKKFLSEADRYEIRDAVLEKQKIFEYLKEK